MKINNYAERGTAYTTAPVQVSPAADAEFVDAAGLQSRFGIKRSLAYALLGEGAIRGVSLRRRNQTRGKRLFCVDSVRAYLKRQMENGPKGLQMSAPKTETPQYLEQILGRENNAE